MYSVGRLSTSAEPPGTGETGPPEVPVLALAVVVAADVVAPDEVEVTLVIVVVPPAPDAVDPPACPVTGLDLAQPKQSATAARSGRPVNLMARSVARVRSV